MSALEQYDATDGYGADGPDRLTVAPDAVEIRRNAGLMGLIGLTAGGLAVAWATRLVGGGTVLDWVALGVMAPVALVYLAALVDSRTPLLVADDQGIRVRLGRTWRGLPWGTLRQIEVEPRFNWLRDGRVALVPRNLDRVLDELDGGGRRQSRLSRLLHGSPLAIPVGLSTSVRGTGGLDLAEALEQLARGRTEIVELVGDQGDAEAEVEGGLDTPRGSFLASGHSTTEESGSAIEGLHELHSTTEESGSAIEELHELHSTSEDASTSEGLPIAEDDVVEGEVLHEEVLQDDHDVIEVDESLDEEEHAERTAPRLSRSRLARVIMGWPRRRDSVEEEGGLDTPRGSFLAPGHSTTEEASASEEASTTEETGLDTPRRSFLAPGHSTTEEASTTEDVSTTEDEAVVEVTSTTEHEEESDDTERTSRFDVPASWARVVRPIAKPGSAVEPLVIDDLSAEPAEDPVIGPELAAARTRLGISVDQLADRTRIRPHVIESIEVDDFAPCGGDFYARGHLRTLARVLGIDAAPLLKHYDERYANAPINARAVFEAELASGGGSIRGTRGGPNWSILVAAVMALILAWSVARLAMDSPVDLGNVPSLNGSGGPGGRTVLGDPLPLVLRAAGGGTHVTVQDGTGREVFSGDLAYGESESLSVTPPIRVSSDDGSVEVAVGGEERGPMGQPGEPASETYIDR